MPKKRRSILREKWTEALTSVLPITLLVFLICFVLVPVPNNAMMGFIIGAALLVLGMGLFTLGTDLAMTPIGQHVGNTLTRSKKMWVIALVGFIVGVLITLSEPDLQVLAEQVPGVPNMVLMIAVGVGVGLFLVVALMRIILAVPMKYLLLLCYAVVFIMAQFVPKSFLAVAFDSGGVTTGPMTVPFILALGVGVSAIRNDKDAENDSFGLVALCSVGPILAVMVLFYAVGHWNSYFDAMIYLNSPELYNIQLVLRNAINNVKSISENGASDMANMVKNEANGEAIKYVLIVITMIPVMIIYPFVQKYFIKGIMIGSIKG